MPDIYDQHKAAFRDVEAYVIAKDGKRVATIAFKFPKDGGGRLYAYVHWLGLEMVRGFTSGGGYDKRSAACSAAAANVLGGYSPGLGDFLAALDNGDRGAGWDRCLRDAGFDVWGAV